MGGGEKRANYKKKTVMQGKIERKKLTASSPEKMFLHTKKKMFLQEKC